jgi:pimeloyl-ACP methyl ester carboxylesterase
MYRPFDLVAADGTRLVAWRNANADGPRVLVCNGMGVPPEAWPRLIADGCRYQVAGWNQRGVLGSDRPADPARIEIADHVQDAVALMDALGWEDAILVAWSLGVNVAFELANEHPERVAGLLSVAGVPGGTFDTILAPQLVPRPLRRPLGLGIARTGKALAPQLNLLSRVVPRGRPFAEIIRYSGVVLPMADVRDVQPWVETFFGQDWDWYFGLALALERHGRIDPSFIDVPVTIVAGAVDALTSQGDVLGYARQIRDAEVHLLPGSHCIPLEFPDRIMEMLDRLDVRVTAHRAGRSYLARWTADDADHESAPGVGATQVPPARAPAPPFRTRVRPRAGAEGRVPVGAGSRPWWASPEEADGGPSADGDPAPVTVDLREAATAR